MGSLDAGSEDRNLTWHELEVGREQREKTLGQKGVLIWLTGLSGSGKSTIASALQKKLAAEGKLAYVLDGDNVRHGLNADLGFSPEEREENIRRVREVAKLFVDAGIITIASFISPYKKVRQQIRKSTGSDYIEVFVKCDLDECKKRDPKGLYQKAERGEIRNFTGVSAPYEEPENPEIVVDTKELDVESSADYILNSIKTKINRIDENEIDIEKIKDIAKQAGSAILEVYETDFDTEEKEEYDYTSPLTEADKRSHEIIAQKLNEMYPEILILSEESKEIPYDVRKNWDIFWLVDPLDGTKEFIKRNGEFTVNIALVKNQKPVLGVVYVPVTDTFYFAYKGKAYKQTGSDAIELPIAATRAAEKLRVMVSRSHFGDKTKAFVGNLGKDYELKPAGSSLKLCLVAEGEADLYPRLWPTMEWDTAAAHAIVNAAGKKVREHEAEEELKYNKKNLKNPAFVVE